MENNAMEIAVTISSMEEVQQSLGENINIDKIQNSVESIRKKTRFQYIIVMDMESNVYSYPIEYALGKKYKGYGHERALGNGDSYIFEDKNKLISAIRAVNPIYYNGEQVGVIIVGLLNDTVIQEVKPHIYIMLATIFLALFVGTVAAVILSNSVKNSIFGLEPREIALLLGNRDLILQNIKNGILAIDIEGKLTFFNKTAKEFLGFKEDDKGDYLKNFHSNYTKELMNVLKSGESVYNQEIKIYREKTLLCSHTLLKNHKNEVIGVVSNFQDLTDVKHMAEELTGIKKMTCALRAQNHEFMNKLHTISGLIQLEEYNEAIDYISDVSISRSDFCQTINERIKNVHLAAILLAKYNKALESRIEFELDKDSKLDYVPDSISVDELCSIVGNLIENSIDELIKYENGIIYIRINSEPNGLRIIINDNGPGIDESIRNKIFDRGFTTKEGNRGFGLNIIKQVVDLTGGKITLTCDEGAKWDIFIPI